MFHSSLSQAPFELRDGTLEAHRRLDAAAMRFDLGRRDEYRDYLAWHAALVPSLEAYLERNAIKALLPDWPQRSRAAELLADLAYLGGEPAPVRILDLPRCDGSLLGVAYVLEGLRLSGEMRAQEVEPAIRARASAYITHGAGLKLWPRFVDRLNAIELADMEMEAAIAAANTVFALFERELDAYLRA